LKVAPALNHLDYDIGFTTLWADEAKFVF